MVVENLRLNNPVMEWPQGFGPKSPPTTVEPESRRFGAIGEQLAGLGGTFIWLGGWYLMSAH